MVDSLKKTHDDGEACRGREAWRAREREREGGGGGGGVREGE